MIRRDFFYLGCGLFYAYDTECYEPCNVPYLILLCGYYYDCMDVYTFKKPFRFCIVRDVCEDYFILCIVEDRSEKLLSPLRHGR